VGIGFEAHFIARKNFCLELGIGNWDRALLDFVHKNFILGAIGNWDRCSSFCAAKTFA
jgi:hypothetical protein